MGGDLRAGFENAGAAGRCAVSPRIESLGILICLVVVACLTVYDLLWCTTHGLLMGGVR